jgi:uncharacterized protein
VLAVLGVAALAALMFAVTAMPGRGRAENAVAACGEADAPFAEVQVEPYPRIGLELARTLAEQQRGLMEREYLPPDSGMLFMYTLDTQGGFWMFQTLLPLSIAFIDSNGTIVDIKDMPRLNDPYDQREAASVTYSPAAPYRYALEVNLGWFSAHGVRVGDQLVFCLGA